VSAALAMPCVLPAAYAVAQPSMPLNRARPIDGYAFFRKHTVGLLRRYLAVCMELGRTPSPLSDVVFRGHVSSYHLKTFEDLLIFAVDVDKCIRQLDGVSQSVLVHTVFEDYTAEETAEIMKTSRRSVGRIYGEAIDRLTRQFLDFGLLGSNPEKLSRETAPNQSNDLTN
jgi:hypothetical protein